MSCTFKTWAIMVLSNFLFLLLILASLSALFFYYCSNIHLVKFVVFSPFSPSCFWCIQNAFRVLHSPRVTTCLNPPNFRRSFLKDNFSFFVVLVSIKTSSLLTSFAWGFRSTRQISFPLTMSRLSSIQCHFEDQILQKCSIFCSLFPRTFSDSLITQFL